MKIFNNFYFMSLKWKLHFMYGWISLVQVNAWRRVSSLYSISVLDKAIGYNEKNHQSLESRYKRFPLLFSGRGSYT